MSDDPSERDRQVRAGDSDESEFHRALESFVGKFILYVSAILIMNFALSLVWSSRFSLSTFISLSGLIGCMGHLANFWNLYVNYDTPDVVHVWAICAGLVTLMYFHPM